MVSSLHGSQSIAPARAVPTWELTNVPPPEPPDGRQAETRGCLNRARERSRLSWAWQSLIEQGKIIKQVLSLIVDLAGMRIVERGMVKVSYALI